jgi:hypothetical protein
MLYSMSRTHARYKHLWWLVGIAVVGVIAFEILIRIVPPDAVQYTRQTSLGGGPITTITGTMTDRATIAQWQARVMAHPQGLLLTDVYLAQWQGTLNCSATYGQVVGSYRFTWHGIPVESVALARTCGGRYEVSSGGLTDPRLFVVDVGTMP